MLIPIAAVVIAFEDDGRGGGGADARGTVVAEQRSI